MPAGHYTCGHSTELESTPGPKESKGEAAQAQSGKPIKELHGNPMAKQRTATTERILQVDTPSTPLNLRWHSASTTKLGFVRTVNEDALLDAREQNLWVVADGMGGHSYGDEASRAIIDQLVGFRFHTDIDTNIEDLKLRLARAHEQCRTHANGQLMGSTVAALFVHDPYCFFLWAGDSRIYRYRDQKLEQVTEDHSLVQGLVSIGELQKEDMDKHPSSHIITRAVGVHNDLDLELRHDEIRAGDRYLVCSDGLYKDVTEKEIDERMGKSTVEESLDSLVDLALERGGTDNTTAIVVQASNGSA